MYICEKRYSCSDCPIDHSDSDVVCEHLIEVDYVTHAKWLPTRIRDVRGEHLYDEWKCSNCETSAETNYKPKLGKYCSECGARMDK